MKVFLTIFFFAIVAKAGYEPQFHMNQGSAIIHYRLHKHMHAVPGNFTGYNLGSRVYQPKETEPGCDDHWLKNGLPGQPTSEVNFKQFAGDIVVDKSSGRSLFYYFVESPANASTKPLILWLNGGPGCSSLGMGALTEIRPFGVNPDGKTLYARQYAWNQVANVLFLESPAGVGFSYSNTTSDYEFSGDQRTAEDTYAFLMKWFRRYTRYQGRDFYLIGESYAGHYIPELADIIVENIKDAKSTPVINLRGIMIGNGLIDDLSDTKGLIDFAWSHGLVSDEARDEFLDKCTYSLDESPACSEVFVKIIIGIGNLDFLNIYGPLCPPSATSHAASLIDPCDLLYVQSYLNHPEVQEALNANRSKLPYPWMPCSHLRNFRWNDSPLSMFPIYKRLMGYGLRILLYRFCHWGSNQKKSIWRQNRTF